MEHDHMQPVTNMPMLPAWARIGWALILGGVVLVHLWHARVLHGQPRWWHIGHTTVAVAMVTMFLLPRPEHPALYAAGIVLFAAITLAEAAVTVVHRRREGVLNPLWVSSTSDKLAMTYMALSPALRPVGVTLVFVLYSAGQAVAWTWALWDRAPALRRPVTVPSGAVLAGAAGSVGGGVGLAAPATAVTRTSLAMMATGMAFMLAMALM